MIYAPIAEWEDVKQSKLLAILWSIDAHPWWDIGCTTGIPAAHELVKELRLLGFIAGGTLEMTRRYSWPINTCYRITPRGRAFMTLCSMPLDDYQVEVTGIGQVYTGNSPDEAHAVYYHHRGFSINGVGKSANQDVTLIYQDEITLQHFGSEEEP